MKVSDLRVQMNLELTELSAPEIDELFSLERRMGITIHWQLKTELTPFEVKRGGSATLVFDEATEYLDFLKWYPQMMAIVGRSKQKSRRGEDLLFKLRKTKKKKYVRVNE